MSCTNVQFKFNVMNVKSMIGGILAAGAIGVAIGILLAPASGKETNAKLLKGTRKLADELKGLADHSIESIKGKFNSGVDEFARKGKESINSASERIKVS
jgi:gas vesicle protein